MDDDIERIGNGPEWRDAGDDRDDLTPPEWWFELHPDLRPHERRRLRDFHKD